MILMWLVLSPLILMIAALLFTMLFIMPKERFPRWLFGLLCAWWWPKRETPATLLHCAVDCMDDATVEQYWHQGSSRYGGPSEWQCPSLGASINHYNNDGKMSLIFKSNEVRLNPWDDYVLAKVSKRVAHVKRNARETAILRDAAQTMLDATVELKEHIVLLEKRARAALPPPSVSEYDKRVATRRKEIGFFES